MKQYRVILRHHTIVDNVLTDYGHYTTVSAENEFEARTIALDNIRQQMVFGGKNNHFEWYWVMNHIKWNDINLNRTSLEVVEL